MGGATTRVGLIKPAGGEPMSVDDLNTNSDTVDKRLGTIQVNPGVIPPSTDLYDGALVAEKTTGFVWRAESNGSGGFNRKWVSVPTSWGEVTRSGQSIVNQATGVPVLGNGSATSQGGWTTLGSGIGASGLRPAIKGLYLITWQAIWQAQPDSGATGHRLACVMLNGASMGSTVISGPPIASSVVGTQQGGAYFTDDPGASANVYQIGLRQSNAGAVALTVDFTFRMILLTRTDT